MVKLLVTELGRCPRYVTGSQRYVCLHLALFDNPESLEWLVTSSYYDTRRQLHSLAAAWWIWRSTQSADSEQPSKEAINPVSKPRLSRAMISKEALCPLPLPLLGLVVSQPS